MIRPVIWVHEDALSQSHPVFSAAKNAKAVLFIWDNEYFQSQGYTVKRLLFIYECLLEMDVQIIKGNTLEVLSDFCEGEIFTASTPNPYFLDIIEQMGERSSKVTLVEDDPFSQIPQDEEMERFFRFWNKGRKSIMKPNAGL